jgi:hypothetical protein
VNQPWWAAFGAGDAPLRCGDAEHRLCWADGKLHAVDHADADGELVLAALGGDTSPCLDLLAAWGRHSADLTVLTVGPRSSADAVTIPAAVLDEINELSDPAAQVNHGHGNPVARRGTSARSGVAATSVVIYAGRSGRAARSQRPIPPHITRQAALRRARTRARAFGRSGSRSFGWTGVAPHGMFADDADQPRIELIRLLALGAPFQFRLSAAVAHAWSADGEHAAQAEKARPALTAALAGRLAPAAAQWLHIDPDEVDATIHDDAGWGEITRVATDGGARLLAKLPVAWLSTVWAPGFAMVGSHLVVAVLRADWPHASVLALRAPGQDPVELSIRQDKGHWSVASR